MNNLPMVLRFCSGSSTPASALRNVPRRVDVHQRNVVAVAEQRHDLLRLAEPQQAVIDEHAGELLADRLVDEHGGDRRVDAAGQSADHAALADLLADFLDRLVLEGAHGPVAGKPGDLAHEIAQQRGAVRRVHHLEMELGGVEFARRRRR